MQSEWISVKDRLPDPYKAVIVAIYDAFLEATYRSIAWRNLFLMWESNEKGFREGELTVTHWMPLPGLPKEDDDDSEE